SLPFQKIQHSITAQDHQPTPDSCILSMVVGQLKADDDQVLGFQQTFLLKSFHGAWVCTNEVFRLALHNADEDPIMGFHQMFLLKNINDAWVCTNDMFRLALHNFG
ncbi:nuclear transport factor 2, partial [Antrostomus carolinensis]